MPNKILSPSSPPGGHPESVPNFSFQALVRKEMLHNLLSFRFSLAYILCTFLLIGSAGIMLADFMEERRAFEVNSTIYKRQALEQNSFWDYFWSTKAIVREPLITKIFAIGAEKDADPKADVAPEFSPYFKGDFKRNPLSNFFPSLDMVFIVGVMLSLLLFVIAYDAVSGEREEGTLKVLLSCPVPRDQVILAKALGGILSLLIPFAIACAVILLLMILVPGLSVPLGQWVRILGIIAACSLYIAVLYSFALMVSVWVRQSSTSILVLLLAWAVGIFIIPSLSSAVVYLTISPPGVEEYAASMRRIGIVNYNDHDKKREEFIAGRFPRFKGKKRDELSPADRLLHEQAGDEYWRFEIRSMVQGIIDEGRRLTRNDEKVEHFSRWIARLSPYGCLQHIATSLAATGWGREKRMRASLEEYALKTVEFSLEVHSQKKQTIRIENAPAYVSGLPSLAESVGDCLPDIFILILMGLGFFMTAYFGFLRMEAL